MSEAALSLLEQIRALPDDDQRSLALELGTEPLVNEAEAVAELDNDPDFQTHLDERLAAVEAHPERLIDGAEAFRRIRRHLAERRGKVVG